MTLARESAMKGKGFVAIEGAADEATGEAEGMGLRVAFDRRLKLEFHGATVTSDAGLLAFPGTRRRRRAPPQLHSPSLAGISLGTS